MKEQFMRFGDFIRKKRMEDLRGITLSEMAKKLGISMTFLSDIENNRRRPFDAARIENFAAYLELPKTDIAKLYDLAGRERGRVPSDIEDILMYEAIGEMARFALRESLAGNITAEDWKRFISVAEKRRGGV